MSGLSYLNKGLSGVDSGGSGGSSAFNDITSGTNTTATMVVDTGASLAASGSGVIIATAISTADEVSDSTCFPLFANNSGTQTNQNLKTNTSLTYNATTGLLGAVNAKLTGLAASAATNSPIIYTDTSGNLTADINDLTWDDTNKRLGINQQGITPSGTLDVHSSSFTVPIAQFNQTGTQSATGGAIIQVQADSGAALGSGNRLGALQYTAAYDASGNTNIGATIHALATQNWTSTANGTQLQFYTTANGAASRSLALTLGQDQKATFSGAINASTLTASQAVVTDASKNLISLAYGSTATASTLVLRDANVNTFANSFVNNVTNNAPGGTTTITLTSASSPIQTVTTAQQVSWILPDARTLPVNFIYKLSNLAGSSNGTITDANSTVLFSNLLSSTTYELLLTDNSTLAGTWKMLGAYSSNGSIAVNALGAIGSSPNANGASISLRTLTLQPASASFGGVVTNTAQTFAGQKTFNNAVVQPYISLTDASTVAIDMSLASNFRLVTTSGVGSTRTLGAPSNPVAGQSGTITVRQDSTGSRLLTYAWCYISPYATLPVLSTGKGAMDILTYQVLEYSTGTATMTIATPCVVTWTAHGLSYGQMVAFSTTGALPTGISANTRYYVNVIDANTFNLSTTLANLQAGTYVATSGSQSGTHTVTNMAVELGITPNNYA